VIAFIMVGVIIARALKLDPIVATAITFGANFVGFSVGFLNPYTVGIAQDIAGLPIFSGALFRIIIFLLMLSITIGYTWRYAKKIMYHSELSLIGTYQETGDTNRLNTPFTTIHKLIIGFVALCLCFFVY
ncbi:hypothetical protein CHM34_18805, partial [Paludifilum halophilum]